MRLFLALNLDAALRDSMYRAMAPLRAAAPGIAWVAAERLHVTLKFLGSCREEDVPALAGAMREVAARHRPLELDLGGVGAFPARRRPRVIWIGIAADPRLELLQHDVETACERLGYAVEGRAFRPHVTLGRARQRASGAGANGARATDARALATAARTVTFRETAMVDTLDLMESRLHAGASRYDVVAAARLGPR